ncbi:MAG: response regulator [Planctomycetales bacterium]|nr:response regulator [Planctomycetales bacterium]
MAKTSVLVVEDDRSHADILRYNLEQAGYDVTVARDGADGLRRAQLKVPDVVLLDVMLPEIDGIEVCRRLRANPSTQNVLIIMVTAKSEETDEVVGFAVGADDYVTKPFSVKVLQERIKALMRRRQGEDSAGDSVTSQGVTVDRSRHRVSAGDRQVQLTRSEFNLLDSLIRQPGRAFSRNELIQSALGDDALVLERTIDVHIRGLRKKMGEYGYLIETVRGIGYRFRDPAHTD